MYNISTQDGLRANITATNILGADFDNDKPYFPSPTSNTFPVSYKIYVIMDPPHMLKLMRGCLKHHQLFHNGIPMHWEFIKNLHEMQKARNINLGNKLTDMHLNFEGRSMNVRLAGQTINHAVAAGIDQLRMDGYEEFKNSEKTTEILRIVKNCFDAMNFKPDISGASNNFKMPLNQCTASSIFALFKRSKAFFKSIEIDEPTSRKRVGEDGQKVKTTTWRRKLAIQSKNFTPFFGFTHNCTAFEGLYTDYVENGPLEALFTFQFCQDHLETWFASARSRSGE